jgi:hypothetical protein
MLNPSPSPSAVLAGVTRPDLLVVRLSDTPGVEATEAESVDLVECAGVGSDVFDFRLRGGMFSSKEGKEGMKQ